MSDNIQMYLLTFGVPVLAALTGYLVLGLMRRVDGKRLARAFEADPDYQGLVAGLSTSIVRSRNPRSSIQAIASGRGVGRTSVLTWTITVDGIDLAGRTTFAISDENLARPLLEKLGLRDVEVGDAKFDAKYLIKASDPEVARAVLARFEVQSAVNFVWVRWGRSIVLDHNGRLTVETRREQGDALQARQCLNAVAALADALRAPELLTLPPASTEGRVESLAASSGAPVGVRGRS